MSASGYSRRDGVDGLAPESPAANSQASAVLGYESAFVGRLISERYLILGLLGEEDATRLFLAEDVKIGRKAVVVIVHPSIAGDETAHADLFRRASRASLVIHRNVTAVYDVGRTVDGHLFRRHRVRWWSPARVRARHGGPDAD